MKRFLKRFMGELLVVIFIALAFVTAKVICNMCPCPYAMANETSDQNTDNEPISPEIYGKFACNCDRLEALEGMPTTVERLTNELNTTQANEADAWAALAEAQAEIERLKAENAKLAPPPVTTSFVYVYEPPNFNTEAL